jgi:predicted GIY-YIG superfamily endonuclease
MTNRPNRTLYVGCTTNIERRVSEHRIGAVAQVSDENLLSVFFLSIVRLRTAPRLTIAI